MDTIFCDIFKIRQLFYHQLLPIDQISKHKYSDFINFLLSYIIYYKIRYTKKYKKTFLKKKYPNFSDFICFAITFIKCKKKNFKKTMQKGLPVLQNLKLV